MTIDNGFFDDFKSAEAEFDEDFAQAQEVTLKEQNRALTYREYFQARDFHDACGDR